MAEDSSVEFSIVIPCRNEQETIAATIQEAEVTIQKLGVVAEIIVADNASDDDSREIASEAGARIIQVSELGYGSALKAGIAAARGTFVILGDADGSYDFGECGRLLEVLRRGNSLVLGCRLPGGGGSIEAGAMPWSHRYIGNPLLTLLSRILFRVPVHDVYCGLRGFIKNDYAQLNLEQTGMSFAVEMIVKFTLAGMPIGEIPIRLRTDGRTQTKSHLRTLRDGWGTLSLLMNTWFKLHRGALVLRSGG
ncbi:MAG: glycosyltransferase family 2 protein [Gammaproteobacteria bacterium]|jgi:glycosyltransferase involved in cell wall biosynthesis|nr:glycosyltransferase family 2 protein [Gammaproteobacteria bacterium]MBT7370385.1 glycosyltransferase family 2 protein [Gammaproteobacteria bacterium]